jgi:hypothetical protein
MARAVKGLFSQIPFPGPDVDPHVFDVDEIWKFLEDNARDIQAGFMEDLISVGHTHLSKALTHF